MGEIVSKILAPKTSHQIAERRKKKQYGGIARDLISDAGDIVIPTLAAGGGGLAGGTVLSVPFAIGAGAAGGAAAHKLSTKLSEDDTLDNPYRIPSNFDYMAYGAMGGGVGKILKAAGVGKSIARKLAYDLSPKIPGSLTKMLSKKTVPNNVTKKISQDKVDALNNAGKLSIEGKNTLQKMSDLNVKAKQPLTKAQIQAGKTTPLNKTDIKNDNLFSKFDKAKTGNDLRKIAHKEGRGQSLATKDELNSTAKALQEYTGSMRAQRRADKAYKAGSNIIPFGLGQSTVTGFSREHDR